MSAKKIRKIYKQYARRKEAVITGIQSSIPRRILDEICEGIVAQTLERTSNLRTKSAGIIGETPAGTLAPRGIAGPIFREIVLKLLQA